LTDYDKQPLSISEQLAKLESRGLCIDDKSYVEHHLNTIGFYRLSAYFIPFEDPANGDTNHAFTPGTKFDDVLALYHFDRNLRLLLLEALEAIEIAARSTWSNTLTLATADAHAYMDARHFKAPRQHLTQLSHVASQLHDSHELFVQHYHNKYRTPFLPPTWAMTETLSFGALSKWYANTENNEVKKAVADLLGIPSVELTDKALATLTLVRNTCAHHSRLWNRQFTKQIPHIKQLRKWLVVREQTTATGETQRQPDRRLYNYLVLITHMLRHARLNIDWTNRLIAHISALNDTQQIDMGFPESWREMAFWSNNKTHSSGQ
jgi:abortive infection bacteriophage resistance protein